MVKWPFSMVKWPPARGLKGSLWITWNRMFAVVLFSALLFWPETSRNGLWRSTPWNGKFISPTSYQLFFWGRHVRCRGCARVCIYIYIYLFIYAYIFSCIPEHRLRVLNPQVSASKLHDSFGMKNPGRSWGYPPKIFQQSEPNHKVIIEVQELNYC